jgi:hypothetical protein
MKSKTQEDVNINQAKQEDGTRRHKMKCTSAGEGEEGEEEAVAGWCGNSWWSWPFAPHQRESDALVAVTLRAAKVNRHDRQTSRFRQKRPNE